MTAKKAAPRKRARAERDEEKAAARTAGFAVIAWIETHCVYPDGHWIGQPFQLLGWQKRWILALFRCDPAGRRIARWCYLQTSKKSGKTSLLAALALYFLIGDDEPAPLIVCAAASDAQADLVFGYAKRIAEMSPTLYAVTERFDKEIVVPSKPGAVLRRVAAADGTNDGPNIYVAILDELHEWRGRKGEAVWTVLTNAGAARRNPLVVQATTPGFDKSTICFRQYEYAKQVGRGEVDDPQLCVEIHEATDLECALLDPTCLRQGNPSYGVTVQHEFYVDQAKRKPEAVYRRYFLGQWTDSEETWEIAKLWPDLSDEALMLDAAHPVIVGIDLSLRRDSTAVIAGQKIGPITRVVTRVWQNPHRPDTPQWEAYQIPVLEVEAHLRALKDAFPVPAREVDREIRPGPAFFYDPAMFFRTAQVLEGDGLNMIPYKQTDAYMIPAAASLFEVTSAGLLVHDGNPVVTEQMRNVVPEMRPNGMYRISKPKGSRLRIDAAVATAIVVRECEFTPPERPAETPPPVMASFR